ncbi:MAG TPA: bifunctional pyr operon transcriptional regulator/uracil phosphoribosyltransferase PyrR [Chthoniobacterales bacterium]|jgi:pyrimidine operon attenuation protein/uracil phosphoribosyltransferase|nr:bifunctional pyr operon transcriptional regulator/uracil phosphoribosyltransferase PyrR [Chthoniobacterales bacterium]
MSKTRPTNESDAVRIFDAETMQRALRRIAHEIIERNRNLSALVLVGIPARGVELARRLAAVIEAIEKVRVATGVIDVSMHRDDIGTRRALPVVKVSQLPLPLEQRTVVIVDDVLFTGRTCRAAMDAIGSFGRPACIQLAALVDRGHRELPIRPDFVGKNLPTAFAERVRVRLENIDHQPDGVWLLKPEANE